MANFPVLVRLTPERFDYAAASADGSDLRFYDDDGAAMAFEIESWDPSGESLIWVRVASLEQAVGHEFWAYYANAAPPAAPAPATTWDAAHAGVWHLDDLDDATSNANHGANVGSLATVGAIGAGRSFAGGGERIEVPPAANLQITGSITVSAMVRYQSFDADPNSNTLVIHVGPGNNPADNTLYRVEYEPANLDPDDGLWFVWRGNNTDQLVKSPLTPSELEDGDWHYLAMVRDIGQQTAAFFVDGQAVGGPKAYTWDATGGTAGNLTMGANPASPASLNLDGDLDEVRIAATPRSWEYIALDYKSVSDSLLGYAPSETQP